jgi:hypothetical protein
MVEKVPSPKSQFQVNGTIDWSVNDQVNGVVQLFTGVNLAMGGLI